ncbi:MAG: FliM/FliN family flagellar motor switch protein [Sphingomonadales bacterium]|nr:FliM/FliN family flagellar motor switch protein [Sphingomonadales bacterium]
MKPERSLIAERPLAQHCPELLRSGPDPVALMPLLGRMGERLARRLSGVLAPLMGGEAPVVRCQTPREGTLGTLSAAAMSPLAANSLMAMGAAGTPVLVSIDAEPVLRIVDRAFGGKGDAPMPLPDKFPMAADLMIARLETLVTQQIAMAIETVAPEAVQRHGVPTFTPVRRDGALAQLEPFETDTPLAILPLEVEDDGLLPWALTFALPLDALPALFGQAEASAAAPRNGASNPWDAPFADLPLSVRAVIVDMAIPFATIAALQPGQVIPVAVARSVPLMTGDVAFAHGTVGAVDDRVAIQINDAFQD